MPCFFAPQMSLEDNTVQLGGTEYHHIVHVFRRKEGDEILLTNGKGLLADCKIENINKHELKIEILKIHEFQRTTPNMAIAFPLLKNKHDNMIIEKLTELGVKDFFPITTKRTVRKPSANTIEKFEKIAIAAMKQCDNAFLPKIHAVQDLSQLLHKNTSYHLSAAVEVGDHGSLYDILDNYKNLSVCIIIGPEGGYDDDEIDLLKKMNIPTFTLGNHILRAETAAIASISQIVGKFLQNDPQFY